MVLNLARKEADSAVQKAFKINMKGSTNLGLCKAEVIFINRVRQEPRRLTFEHFHNRLRNQTLIRVASLNAMSYGALAAPI